MKISDQLLIMGALYLFLITLITYQYITDPANFFICPEPYICILPDQEFKALQHHYYGVYNRIWI